MIPPGQPGYTQPSTVIMQTAPHNAQTVVYARKQSLGLGIVQILCGVLCIIANIAGIALSESDNYYTTGFMYVGYGIWCGFFFLVSGALGIEANKTPTTGLVVGHMVMSIISACFCTVLLSMGSINAAIANDCGYLYGRNCHSRTEYGLSILMLLLSLVEAFAAIWASAICCAAFCCRTQGTNTGTVLTGQVQPTTGVTVINFPAQQAVGAYPQQSPGVAPPYQQQPGGVAYPVPQQPGGVTYPVPQQPGGVTYPVPQQPGGVTYHVPQQPGGVSYPAPQQPGGVTCPLPQPPGGVGDPPQQPVQKESRYEQLQHVKSTATNATAPPAKTDANDYIEML